MNYPLLLEFNARCWLHEVSEVAGRRVTLGTIPEEELDRWRRMGFTHVWPMGIWTTGPKSKRASQTRHLQEICDQSFGNHKTQIGASPYSICDYSVLESLGGQAGLLCFRKRLRELGMKLILDFVPNHVGLDHPWLREHPEYFLLSRVERMEHFYQMTTAGPRWFAHGKDPYFPAWMDTAQLNYFNPATHEAMVGVLQQISELCDGVRCDMAMLVLNSVFKETWKSHPQASTETNLPEFWSQAIASIKSKHPDFLFMAEAYWNLETRLQELGFDYTYDKFFRDHLLRGDRDVLKAHLELHSKNPKMVRFLENHDEPPVAPVLSLPDHKNAAQLLLSQPCLRLIYYNQMEGRKLHTPVQFTQYRPEPPNPEARQIYENLLLGSGQ